MVNNESIIVRRFKSWNLELKLTFRQKRKKFNVYSITFVGSKVDWNRNVIKLNHPNILWMYEIYSTLQNVSSFFFPSITVHNIFYLLTIIVLNDNIFAFVWQYKFYWTIEKSLQFRLRETNKDWCSLLFVSSLYKCVHIYTCIDRSYKMIFDIYRWKIVNTQKPFIQGIN